MVTQLKQYHRMATLTFILVLALVFVGAVVRASGAGMGCPDWPKCFDQWVPPVSESQLPAHYHELYAERGYADTHFNVVKTWTEYMNRLLGTVVGLSSIGMGISAFGFWRQRRGLFIASWLIVLGIGFEGWLGSVVVDSQLHSLMVTLHLLVALVIVLALVWCRFESQLNNAAQTISLPERWGLWIVFWGFVAVAGLGMILRGQIDTFNQTLQVSLSHFGQLKLLGSIQIHQLLAVSVALIALAQFGLLVFRYQVSRAVS